MHALRGWSNEGSNDLVSGRDGLPDGVKQNFCEFQIIGSGAYGTVYAADCVNGHRPVALKKIKLAFGDKIDSIMLAATAVREILLLRELRHANIVCLRDVYFKPSSHSVWLCMDRCRLDLRVFVKTINKANHLLAKADAQPPAGLPNHLVKKFAHEILTAMRFTHSLNILHRDLKPQNILLNDSIESCLQPETNPRILRLAEQLNLDGSLGATCAELLTKKRLVCQVADFGLARTNRLHFQALSSEIITLWYRPPEVLLGCNHYNSGVDVWSIGCILAEMKAGRSLFAGDSEIGTLFKIFQLLGTPRSPETLSYKSLPHFRACFPQWTVGDVHRSIGDFIYGDYRRSDTLFVDLVARCLDYDASRRITCAEALQHQFFSA